MLDLKLKDLWLNIKLIDINYSQSLVRCLQSDLQLKRSLNWSATFNKTLKRESLIEIVGMFIQSLAVWRHGALIFVMKVLKSLDNHVEELVFHFIQDLLIWFKIMHLRSQLKVIIWSWHRLTQSIFWKSLEKLWEEMNQRVNIWLIWRISKL